MPTVNVFETFVSLQGESTYAGLPCFFVRLAGCNLRCRYCDTPSALGSGTAREIGGLADEFRRTGLACAEITGGEPLLQPRAPELARALLAAGAAPLLVETNGTRDISVLPPEAVAIVDVKGPGSGASEPFDLANLARLRPRDELKFVICDRADFDWAAAFVRRHGLAFAARPVLFSPAAGRVEPRALGAWILESGLPVRLQLQLHRLIGMP